MRVVPRLVTAIMVLTFLLASWGPSQAQSADVQYFPETGHSVRDDFLRFYKSVKDPKLVFGFPITEQIRSRDGKTVQYFQRARFELHTDQPDGQRVKLTPLGKNSYRPGGQLNIDNSSGCQLFSTGYRVCFTFLDFYRANGGAKQFGNPISPFEFHDQLIVQYFEMARFEWRADRPEGGVHELIRQTLAATGASEPASIGWSPSRSVRATHTTRPPSAAKSFAISAPIPRDAPVTTAVRPASGWVTYRDGP